jgi:hypothetical protein
MTPSTRNAAARLALVLATATLPAACQRASADYEAKSAVTDVALSPDGIPIAYSVSGDGAPALVFVHGWLCDRTYWRGQLEPFSKDHKVVAIDLAGHGESGRGTRSAFTMQSFGGDVAAVVEARPEASHPHRSSLAGNTIEAAATRARVRLVGGFPLAVPTFRKRNRSRRW